MTNAIAQPRKILMTADAVGGVWTYALELCVGLTEADIEIVLATMGPAPTRSQREAVARMPHVRLECSDFRLEWMPNPWDDIDLAGEWLLGLSESHRPDLVHLNGYVHAALPWTMPTVVVAYSCVWSWWLAVHGTEPPREWHRYRTALAEGLSTADAIVAPSQAMLSSLDLYFAAHPHLQRNRNALPDTVIYNGLALASWTAKDRRAPFIFSAGRLCDKAKNIGVLDTATRNIARPVYVAGEPVGPHGTEIELQHARALGPLTSAEMQRWLARAAIYALPALYEPFGLSVLEAAAHGCALVLGDISSLREIWGDAAIYVPPCDADRWSGELNRLIADPELVQEYSIRAQECACRYTREAMVGGYLALYASLLERRPTREHVQLAARSLQR